MTLIMPGNIANMNNNEQLDKTDVSITLYDNAERIITIDENSYMISGTNALTALLIAAEKNGCTYQINDEFYKEFDSFFVKSFMGIENDGWDGWQYWVNYPEDEIPMVGANNYELEDGDTVSWFYSVFDENKTNPETSDYVVNIDITIKSDQTKPNISLTKPSKGGVYLNNNQIFTIPLIPSSIIINPITISVDANDEESGLSSVSFAIDNTVKFTESTAPFHWEYEPRSGLNKVTLTVTATDRSNNQQVIQKQLLTLN